MNAETAKPSMRVSLPSIFRNCGRPASSRIARKGLWVEYLLSDSSARDAARGDLARLDRPGLTRALAKVEQMRVVSK